MAYGVPVPEGNDLGERKTASLDDVPISVKKARYQDNPTGIAQLPTLTMHAVTFSSAMPWLDKYQLDGMSSLMDRHVQGVRVHESPRRRLYDHGRHQHCGRVSLMMKEDGSLSVKDAGIQRSKDRMEFDGVLGDKEDAYPDALPDQA